jgi:hypothetical protein
MSFQIENTRSRKILESLLNATSMLIVVAITALWSLFLIEFGWRLIKYLASYA